MRRSSRRLCTQSGFTLVELMVAVFIIAGALLGMITLQLRSLGTVNLSKQRQQATDLADRTMEQLRALPYDTIKAGLSSSDLSETAPIYLVSGRLRPTSFASSIDEQLVTGATTLSPLNLHRRSDSSTRIGNTQFAISSYVTLVSAAANDVSQGYWLTVIVNWNSGSATSTVKQVMVRSQVYSPTGCLATSNHPFSGPCQAFYDGAAGTTPAGISVVSAGATGTTPLAGNDMTSGGADLPSLSMGVQSEQTVAAQGKAAASAAHYLDSSSSTTAQGGQGAATGASTDPATGGSSPPSTANFAQAAQAVTKATSTGTFAFQDASDTGASSSTTAALSGASCLDLSSTVVTGGQACSSGNFAPGGPVSSTLTYAGGNIPLASVAASATTSKAFVARFLSSTGSYCTGASGTGCISGNVTRSLGNGVVGGAPTPATGLPSGWLGSMITLTGYGDSASTEAGPGAQPAASSRTGTLMYWSGSGYTSVPLSSATNSTYPLTRVTYGYSGSSAVTVRMTGSVTVGPSSAKTGAPQCQAPVTCASSTSGSLLATVTYAISAGNAQSALFTVTLDLGSAAAQASYRVAPSA